LSEPNAPLRVIYGNMMVHQTCRENQANLFSEFVFSLEDIKENKTEIPEEWAD